MKKTLLALCVMALLVASCNLPSTVAPGKFETPVVTAVSTIPSGGAVALKNVRFTLPLGVAKGAQSEVVPAVTDPNTAPWWGLAPEHLQFTLTGYQVEEVRVKPQIFVYPADELAKVNPTAADQIQRIKNLTAGSTLTRDAMPVVPFFNAAQQMASHMQLIDFKNGHGVRFLTQYAQYPAPINNHDLFYHFQGLTSDGKYYVVAVLPVTSSILAENEKPESPVPAGGVPLPAGGGPDQAYYDAVTKALDAMYEDSFNPSLFQLDGLIQSITITP
ncbi:MAG: hypothetical protein ACM3XO_11760 [Bacteroidota bacterium]